MLAKWTKMNNKWILTPGEKLASPTSLQRDPYPNTGIIMYCASTITFFFFELKLKNN